MQSYELVGARGKKDTERLTKKEEKSLVHMKNIDNFFSCLNAIHDFDFPSCQEKFPLSSQLCIYFVFYLYLLRSNTDTRKDILYIACT